MEALDSGTRPNRRPVKIACLACRSQRIRCDGLETCERCRRTGKECVYVQSRRGRRRINSTTYAATSSQAIGVSGGTGASHHIPARTDLDADFCADFIMDDDDAVFDSIFFNPAYPFTPVPDVQMTTQLLQVPCYLRQYRCDHDILDAYYTWIHPTFPLLPDPETDTVDRPLEWLPVSLHEFPAYTPSNPLVLAILAIVVTIPLPGGSETDDLGMRRSFSDGIADRAYQNIKFEAQSLVGGSTVHHLVPLEIEDTLALCLLSQYEYLQNGNMDKMQRFAREAMEAAKRLQLQSQTRINDFIYGDACRRAWWTVYLCAYNASIVSCIPPILPLNDHIYTVPYPKSGDWDARVGAERLLVLATLFLVNLIREFGNPAQMGLIRKSMQVLDGEISRSLSELDDHESPGALSIQKKIALVRLHGARIKVHRYCALLDDDSGLSNANLGSCLDGSASAVSVSPAKAVAASPTSILGNSTGTSGSGRHFPFHSALSTRYCLESAGVILQTLQSLPTVGITGFDTKFYTFTPFACSILLAGYTFLMLHHKSEIEVMPSKPSSEGSALLSPRDNGAASCMKVLDGFSRTWMHLQDAAKHMKEAAEAL